MPAPVKFSQSLKVRCIRADDHRHLRVGQTYNVLVVVKSWTDRKGDHNGYAYVLEGVKGYAWDRERFEKV